MFDRTYYFECLRCGVQAALSNRQPRCPKCGCGNGIVSERELPQAIARPADPVTEASRI